MSAYPAHTKRRQPTLANMMANSKTNPAKIQALLSRYFDQCRVMWTKGAPRFNSRWNAGMQNKESGCWFCFSGMQRAGLISPFRAKEQSKFGWRLQHERNPAISESQDCDERPQIALHHPYPPYVRLF